MPELVLARAYDAGVDLANTVGCNQFLRANEKEVANNSRDTVEYFQEVFF